MRHAETKLLPWRVDQMFDLVADVAAYPEFLPWCAAARIRDRRPVEGGEVIEADLVISFKLFRERFGSRVSLWPEWRQIDTEYLDGPFKYLKSQWNFAEAQGGCEVKFFVDFEFKSRILQGLIGLMFNDAMHRVMRAFESRARKIYA